MKRIKQFHKQQDKSHVEGIIDCKKRREKIIKSIIDVLKEVIMDKILWKIEKKMLLKTSFVFLINTNGSFRESSNEILEVQITTQTFPVVKMMTMKDANLKTYRYPQSI